LRDQRLPDYLDPAARSAAGPLLDREVLRKARAAHPAGAAAGDPRLHTPRLRHDVAGLAGAVFTQRPERTRLRAQRVLLVDEQLLPAQRRNPAAAAHLEPRSRGAVLPALPAVPGAGMENAPARGVAADRADRHRVAGPRGIRVPNQQVAGGILSRYHPRLATDARLPDRHRLAPRA